MRKFLPILKRINRLGEKARRKLVQKCNRQLLDCFSECSRNVLKGNVPLKDSEVKKLRREKRNLKALSLRKTSLKKKRKILQKGGFIGALLPPVLSVLGSLLAGVVGNAARLKDDIDRTVHVGTSGVQGDPETGRYKDQI